MTDPKSQRLFRWINWAFYLIWLCFPVFIWTVVRQIMDGPAQLVALAPDQAACLQELPQVALFSAAGRLVFWTTFAIDIAVYAVLLALAHQIVYRCATGKVFVSSMIGSLRMIGTVIAIYPFADLLLQNLSLWAFVKSGDLPFFSPTFTLDVTVIGVGLLFVTMAMAMRMAVNMHADAELTI